jgi:hypothetical protein
MAKEKAAPARLHERPQLLFEAPNPLPHGWRLYSIIEGSRLDPI